MDPKSNYVYPAGSNTDRNTQQTLNDSSPSKHYVYDSNTHLDTTQIGQYGAVASAGTTGAGAVGMSGAKIAIIALVVVAVVTGAALGAVAATTDTFSSSSSSSSDDNDEDGAVTESASTPDAPTPSTPVPDESSPSTDSNTSTSTDNTSSSTDSTSASTDNTSSDSTSTEATSTDSSSTNTSTNDTSSTDTSNDTSSSNDNSSDTTPDPVVNASAPCPQCYTPSCQSSSNNTGSCVTPAVSIADGSGSTRFTLTANNYPCHDMNGSGIYVTCPSGYSESMTFPIPVLCSSGQYHNGSSCNSFTWSQVQPHFGDVGFLGRPLNKNSHWSSTHFPIEGVSYDPLPAECGDETPHQCNQNYTGEKRFSVMDVQRLTDDGNNVTFDDGGSLNVSLDAYNSHVQPGGSTNPSSATYGLYHYHGYPGWDNGDYADYVIGYAKDGVPIMGRNSKLESGSTATSSYSLRSGKTGVYHMDYEYDAGSGTLDEFNGGTVLIDEVSTYCYFSTSGYPYIFRNFHGSY